MAVRGTGVRPTPSRRAARTAGGIGPTTRRSSLSGWSRVALAHLTRYLVACIHHRLKQRRVLYYTYDTQDTKYKQAGNWLVDFAISVDLLRGFVSPIGVDYGCRVGRLERMFVYMGVSRVAWIIVYGFCQLAIQTLRLPST